MVDADPTLAKNVRILQIYILAGQELKGARTLDAAAAMALANPWQVRERFGLVRKFAKAGRPEDAWRLLSIDPETLKDAGFIRQAKRLYGAVKDAGVKREIHGRLTEATGGGLSAKPAPSAIAFLGVDRPTARLGTAHAAASAEVPPRHLAGFESEMLLLQTRLRSPTAPKVVEFNDVFVDRFGQIWREGGEIIQTNGRPIPDRVATDVRRLDAACHAIMGTRGIYHWLVDQSPRFGMYLDPAARPVPVVIAAGSPRFERETLELLKRSLGVQYAEVDEPVFVSRLLMPRVGFAGLMYPDATQGVFDALKSEALKAAKKKSYGEKIYISRRDAKRRPMVNEETVEKEMNERGFNVLRMADLPIADQIAAAAGAKVIAGPHGAGLAHVLFAERGAKIVEILPIMDGAYALRFNYARLCTALGHDYSAWLEHQRAGTDKWTTELPQFLPFLDQALA
ncbi:glycosyltransferase 61 family protein [Methylopila sp. 73B]|uniref:glycosyltransferase family 61 protein n=1 Tax=Methylopila sp. 73B TaxID=1120792 RepID=UPI0018CC64FE|nr:glycosyltransferase 61 family protein [Methylopila sp. 73B]